MDSTTTTTTTLPRSEKILILGCGSLGSQLSSSLLPDLRGEHQLTILDWDEVEKRNIQAGTQLFFPEQLGRKKTESLQYNLYKLFQKQVKIITEKLSSQNVGLLKNFNLIVDTFDNFESRKLVQDFVLKNKIDCLHCGFSSKMTYEICWNRFYEVPSDDTSNFDICTAEGARSFIQYVAGLAGMVVSQFLNHDTKLNFVGNKFVVRKIT